MAPMSKLQQAAHMSLGIILVSTVPPILASMVPQWVSVLLMVSGVFLGTFIVRSQAEVERAKTDDTSSSSAPMKPISNYQQVALANVAIVMAMFSYFFFEGPQWATVLLTMGAMLAVGILVGSLRSRVEAERAKTNDTPSRAPEPPH